MLSTKQKLELAIKAREMSDAELQRGCAELRDRIAVLRVGRDEVSYADEDEDLTDLQDALGSSNWSFRDGVTASPRAAATGWRSRLL